MEYQNPENAPISLPTSIPTSIPTSTPTQTMECNNKPDIDNNGVVNISDLASLLVSWGPCNDSNVNNVSNDVCIEDLNCDGLINIQDLAELLVSWG